MVVLGDPKVDKILDPKVLSSHTGVELEPDKLKLLDPKFSLNGPKSFFVQSLSRTGGILGGENVF